MRGGRKKRKEENPYLTDIDPQKIQDVIDNLNLHDFDLCIIDTPGDTSINAISSLEVANLVLVPSKPSAPDHQAIGRTIATIKRLEKPYLLIITQAVARTKLAMQGASVLSEFGVVAPVTIGNRIAYANAMNVGSSAAEEDKSAEEEVTLAWNLISTRLFNKEVGDAKEKVRFNV